MASSEEVFTKMVKEKRTADFFKLDNEKLDPCFVALQKNIEIVLEGDGILQASTRNEEVKWFNRSVF
jgi:hypothetical protein